MACDGVMELMMNIAGTRLLVTDTIHHPQRFRAQPNGATYGVRTGIRHPLFAADLTLIV